MTKKQAIKCLTIQRDKLKVEFILLDELWHTQTASYIKEIFGTGSSEHVTFSNYLPLNDPRRYGAGIAHQDYYNPTIERLWQFMNNCIETVEHKGVEAKPKINFLQKFGNWQMMGMVVASTIAVGSFCFYVGRMYERFEMDKLSPATTNEIPNKPTTNKQPETNKN